MDTLYDNKTTKIVMMNILNDRACILTSQLL